MSTTTLQGLAPVKKVLPNGATVIVERTLTHPAVTVFLSLRAGSGYDPPDAVGLSNFVSRVIDRGTERRTADVFSEELDGRGVSLNTSVGRHLFTVSFTSLTEDFAAVLELAADVVRRPTFPQVEIDTRRREIVTAIRQDEDNPAVMAVESLFELLYPDGHPYGRRSKGTIAGVERITRDALLGFHRGYFSPAGMIAVVVGDVAVDDAIDTVTSAFGDWVGQPHHFSIPTPPARPTHRQQLFIPMPGKAQADIAYGFTAVARRDPDYYPLLAMNNVLGQYGLGGRLGDSIRERQGMAYYAFSSFEGNIAEGPLVIRAGVAPENVERTVASIDEEVRQITSEGVTPQELDDAKRYLIGSMPRNLETNGGIASFLQSAEFFGLGLDFDRRLPALLERVTLEQVHAATRRVLDPDRAAVVIAGPSPAAAASGGQPAA
jgi:zinc protease